METDKKEKTYNWRKSLMDKNYSVLEQIDEGSFGTIHKLHKNGETTIYAVKAIKSTGIVMNDEYILAEIRSLLELHHPHIITMYDLILKENFVCIIMEYAPQGNLERYTIRHHPLDPPFLLRSFQQILSAVSYCHSQFIAHKDINPSNILIFTEYCVKLADFGLAVKCHDASGEIVLCEDYLGQNSYLAPEILTRCPHNSMSADIWSLGCLLYFMLCGKPPFEGSVNQIAQCQREHGIRLDNSVTSNEYFKNIFSVIKDLCKVESRLRVSVYEAIEIWNDLLDKHVITH